MQSLNPAGRPARLLPATSPAPGGGSAGWGCFTLTAQNHWASDVHDQSHQEGFVSQQTPPAMFTLPNPKESNTVPLPLLVTGTRWVTQGQWLHGATLGALRWAPPSLPRPLCTGIPALDPVQSPWCRTGTPHPLHHPWSWARRSPGGAGHQALGVRASAEGLEWRPHGRMGPWSRSLGRGHRVLLRLAPPVAPAWHRSLRMRRGQPQKMLPVALGVKQPGTRRLAGVSRCPRAAALAEARRPHWKAAGAARVGNVGFGEFR